MQSHLSKPIQYHTAMDGQHLASGHSVWNVDLEEKYVKLLVRGQVQKYLTQRKTQCLKLPIDFYLEYLKYTFIQYECA